MVTGARSTRDAARIAAPPGRTVGLARVESRAKHTLGEAPTFMWCGWGPIDHLKVSSGLVVFILEVLSPTPAELDPSKLRAIPANKGAGAEPRAGDTGREEGRISMAFMGLRSFLRLWRAIPLTRGAILRLAEKGVQGRR